MILDLHHELKPMSSQSKERAPVEPSNHPLHKIETKPGLDSHPIESETILATATVPLDCQPRQPSPFQAQKPYQSRESYLIYGQ